MKTIGLVAAMAKELNVFLQSIGKEKSKIETKAFTVYEYEISGKTVYLTDSGVGEVCSAIATQMLIDRFDIDCVINFGVCGSLDSSLNVADIVFGKSVYHFDRDTSMLDGCEVGFYTEHNTKYLSGDSTLLDIATSIFPEIKKVVIASSEKFVASKNLKVQLQEQGANICEMEALGVVLTSIKNDIPCLTVKAISDNADEEAKMSFGEMLQIAMQKCSEVVKRILEKI